MTIDKSQSSPTLHIPVKQYWQLLVDYLKPQRAWALPLTVLLTGSEDLQKAGAGITRVQVLLAVRSKIENTATHAPAALAEKGALTVVFEGVIFGYDDAEFGKIQPVDGPDGRESAQIEKNCV